MEGKPLIRKLSAGVQLLGQLQPPKQARYLPCRIDMSWRPCSKKGKAGNLAGFQKVNFANSHKSNILDLD
jgi:hypothetical protein